MARSPLLMDRIAFALQRDGVANGDAVAICARASIPYAAAFLGALAAGAAVALLAPSSTPASLMLMLNDSGAKAFFIDRETAEALTRAGERPDRPAHRARRQRRRRAVLRLARSRKAPRPPTSSSPPSSRSTSSIPRARPARPRASSSPTACAGGSSRGSPTSGAVTIVSTPLYSNTTLVVFLPTLAHGGTAVLMPKFDAGAFLRLSETHRATHAMLVPVQYRRIMEREDFGAYDLSSFVLKFSTSAPFPAALKADVLKRWPGGLVEFYGMTEGGGSTMLAAHLFPDKLHTVGQPMAGHDIRLIDELGHEVEKGKVGEVVGRSEAMMTGYHNLPEKTREAEWRDAEGRRFIRTGDIGRFDEDGFLDPARPQQGRHHLRRLQYLSVRHRGRTVRHEAVLEAAVVGVASERWGETPVAFVALRESATIDAPALMEWVNARLGKTQRLSALTIVASLPRSAIGKVLKRELRDRKERVSRSNSPSKDGRPSDALWGGETPPHR